MRTQWTKWTSREKLLGGVMSIAGLGVLAGFIWGIYSMIGNDYDRFRTGPSGVRELPINPDVQKSVVLLAVSAVLFVVATMVLTKPWKHRGKGR
ncbi:MAG: hypothetical protein Greene071421_270 [Parcubacteria group bacterium Greene0714_21]|nr:MAG: hypothetical protein Greene071421_270 [Parcubacteria group bacterium Greene0714_21]